MRLENLSPKTLRGAALSGFALLLLLLTGIALPSRPSFETAYDTPPPMIFCQSEKCSASYTLVVGNSGKKEQPDVVVRFDNSKMTAAIIPPRVRGSGKVLRPQQPQIDGGEMTLHTGIIKPGFRVEINFMLHASRSELPDWEEILVDVTPAEGPKVMGSAEVITFGRLIYQILQL